MKYLILVALLTIQACEIKPPTAASTELVSAKTPVEDEIPTPPTSFEDIITQGNWQISSNEFLQINYDSNNDDYKYLPLVGICTGQFLELKENGFTIHGPDLGHICPIAKNYSCDFVNAGAQKQYIRYQECDEQVIIQLTKNR